MSCCTVRWLASKMSPSSESSSRVIPERKNQQDECKILAFHSLIANPVWYNSIQLAQPRIEKSPWNDADSSFHPAESFKMRELTNFLPKKLFFISIISLLSKFHETNPHNWFVRFFSTNLLWKPPKWRYRLAWGGCWRGPRSMVRSGRWAANTAQELRDSSIKKKKSKTKVNNSLWNIFSHHFCWIILMDFFFKLGL